MRILVFTQALDRKDPTLSAYHRLVGEIARNFDSVIAVCLKKGDVDLPANVDVLSLGKEEGRSRLKYISRFYRYIFGQEYDAVLVHMNQEYVLLGGMFWKLIGKKVYLWRNHHKGSFLTDIAAMFCAKIFCTSRFSYTAKYKKTVLMPVGIDTDTFKKQAVAKKSGSVLFLGRIAPVKKPDILIDALALLKNRNRDFAASFYGDPLPKDAAYAESLRQKAAAAGISDRISFFPGVPNDDTPRIYSTHDVFVNLSSSGMYDKTIFEAMACETVALASNKNLHGLVGEDLIFEEGDAAGLADKLEKLLASSSSEKEKLGAALRQMVIGRHSLSLLGKRLAKEIV
ncbi:glycosyltransferase family 4 protein [Candidatus Parcubacteria bacterium]|nr:glycosyltransferase family 4 protein [Candidatus Parcubacteria bacterium]